MLKKIMRTFSNNLEPKFFQKKLQLGLVDMLLCLTYELHDKFIFLFLFSELIWSTRIDNTKIFDFIEAVLT